MALTSFRFNLDREGEVDCWFVDDEGTDPWINRLTKNPLIRVQKIGTSRAGRPLYGLAVGEGSTWCSITAGAHADEPAGPMTAMLLAEWLAGRTQAAAEFRQQYTFMICPQVNPDGAEANKAWFAPVPDFMTYLRHVKREGPGDDVEFGYPGDGRSALRPENEAVAQFLGAHRPYGFHASLHSMGFADGAWFLLNGRLATHRSVLLALQGIAGLNHFTLHDIDRRGEKGFSRIGKGFCTTPNSRAMRDYFLNQGDQAMADKFHYSSMEFASEGNPETLLLVTELPVFALGGGYAPPIKRNKGSARPDFKDPKSIPAPQPGSTAYEKFRDALKACVAAGDMDGAATLAAKYGVTPVPFAVQVQTQLSAVRALAHLI